MRRRIRGPPTLMWTMLRTVTLVSVRLESGCVLAPHVVTQCVPACAVPGIRAAAASAAATTCVSFIRRPLWRGRGQGEDERLRVAAGADRIGGVDLLPEGDRDGSVG